MLRRSLRMTGQPSHKSFRLCGQVANTLNTALGGECGDPVLCNLHVLGVEPGKGGNLRVLVAPIVPEKEFSRREIEGRLAAASGYLRSLVAESITRRKAPILKFRVVGPCARPDEPRSHQPTTDAKPR